MGLIGGLYGKTKGFFLWLLGWEEPQRTHEQVIESRIGEFTVTLNRCKVQVTRLMMEQKQLADKINQNKNRITEHLREARRAATRSEDDAAREHLRQKAMREQIGTALQTQMESYKKAMENLVDTVRKMDIKIDEMKRRKMLLATQKQVAEAQSLLLGGSEGGEEIDVQKLLSDLEEEVLAKQFKAQIDGEATPLSQPLLTAPDNPPAPAPSVEAELAELKKRFTNGKAEDDGSAADEILIIK